VRRAIVKILTGENSGANLVLGVVEKELFCEAGEMGLDEKDAMTGGPQILARNEEIGILGFMTRQSFAI
jgi:hypothetical protein